MESDVSITAQIIGKFNNKNNEEDEVCLPELLHLLIEVGGCRNEIRNDKRKAIRSFT